MSTSKAMQLKSDALSKLSNNPNVTLKQLEDWGRGDQAFSYLPLSI